MFLGIDTSCYTTSVALVDDKENILLNKKQLLPVPTGEKGLSQSEALFNHLKRLPKLLEEVGQLFCYSDIKCIAASIKPRSINNSYMPVFTVSENLGSLLASILKVPFIKTSHQENHLRAGIWSSKINTENFLAIHLSGGTTELLKVKWINKSKFAIQILGGSLDIHAGQLIDRIGVMLGLPFPAGPHLELLARESKQIFEIPSYVKQYSLSFSGPEAAAIRLYNNKKNPADIARSIENCIAKSVEKIIREAIVNEGISDVLFVGGVAANNYIKKKLVNRLEHRAVGAKLYFTEPAYTSDNALGNALIAKDNSFHL